MPAGFTAHCSEPGCTMRFFASPGVVPDRCPKCAAYHRGATSEAGKKFRAEQERLRTNASQRRRRRARGPDATEEREAVMEERAKPLSEFLKYTHGQ